MEDVGSPVCLVPSSERRRTELVDDCVAAERCAYCVSAIIEELVAVRSSERQLRIIDHDQDGSMEMKKREGYF